MRQWPTILLVLILGSCTLFKPPKAPKKAGKYREFTKSDSLIGGLNENRSCYDVTFYDLGLTIDPKKKWIEGWVDIYLTMTAVSSDLQFDLDRKMDLGQIWVNGERHRYARLLEDSFILHFRDNLDIGDELMVTISYSGQPQKAKKPPWKGGLVWDSKKGSDFCGVACEDDGAHIWWPLKDHISDKPDSIRAKFTVPAGLKCISNGRLINKVERDTGWSEFSWATSYPINPYNFTFYLGDYEHFTLPYEGKYDSFPMDFYVLPHNLGVAMEHFKQARNIIYVYEDLFGPYPWPKDGYKLVESPYEGMEHQSAIAYGAGYKNRKYAHYDYIILHETAHEWWGNAVTCCDMADLWIHEGFATYAEMLYEEEKEESWFAQASYFINRGVSLNKRPVVGPKGVSYTNFKDSDIYTKGVCILHNLRTLINKDSVFFTILKRFSTEKREQCTTTEEFIEIVNEETGRDYQWYFDQYVYRREAPELYYHLETDNVNSAIILHYMWNPEVTNKSFKLPLKLTIAKEKEFVVPETRLKSIKISDDVYDLVQLENTGYYILTELKKSEIGAD